MATTTSRTLLCGPKPCKARRGWPFSGTGRRLLLAHDYAVPMPVVGNAGRVVACVAELEAPNAGHLDGRDGELRLRVLALERLDERHAVEDEGAGQADGVDPASFAGAVDAGRAGAERMDHRTLRVEVRPHPGTASGARPPHKWGGEFRPASAGAPV